MKKLILLSLLFVVVLSCKKGSDDPFLTVRSREARLEGEWKVSSFSENLDGVDSEFDTDGATIVFDKNGLFSMTLAGSAQINSTETSSSETFSETATTIQGHTTSYYDTTWTNVITGNSEFSAISIGDWVFLGKSGDYKNKERLLVNVTASDVSETSTTTTVVTTEVTQLDSIFVDEVSLPFIGVITPASVSAETTTSSSSEVNPNVVESYTVSTASVSGENSIIFTISQLKNNEMVLTWVVSDSSIITRALGSGTGTMTLTQ